MHTAIFAVAAVWIAVLLGITIITAVRSRSAMTRVLAIDTVTLLIIGILTLFAHNRQSAYYLDAALALALLSFASTLAAARYHSEGRLF